MKNEVISKKVVPPIPFKKPTAKNLLVKLKSTKRGIPPRAINRVSSITRLMAEKRETRKKEIEYKRFNGLM